MLFIVVLLEKFCGSDNYGELQMNTNFNTNLIIIWFNYSQFHIFNLIIRTCKKSGK